MDDQGTITRNNRRLLIRGYNQENRVEYNETFTLVARMQVIRILVAFASYIGFKFYQMYVKSEFLNGYLKEEVFVCQPLGFETNEFPVHDYKLNKALYRLKQAPRVCYERLSKFLLENGFLKGKIDNILFLMKKSRN